MAESRLITLLKENHYLSKEAVVKVQEGRPATEILLARNYITHSRLKEFYKSVNISCYDLMEEGVDGRVMELLPHEYALRYTVIPIRREGGRLCLAVADPLDYDTLDYIERFVKQPVSAFYSNPKDIKLFIDRYYGVTQAGVGQADLPVKLIDSFIQSARLYAASDIHIEPLEKHIRIRFRIDGRLQEHQRVDSSLLPYIISRLKILGGMDISEKRLPQDGHFKISDSDEQIDFRLSTIPTIYGEKAVLRLIYAHAHFHIGSLGFFSGDLERLRLLLKNPNGAILVTGPTGSGKTTTLACFVNELNQGDINIVTVEDPVENIIPGVNQISINEKAGLTFPSILPYILRQDPDVIMIGEIRDSDTARIAVRSAITGHLVLSTLHTNDALGAVLRLSDMGVERFLITAAVKGVISQRLVRKICDFCKTKARITEEDAKILRLPPDTLLYSGQGCPKCNHSGYRGRFAVYEILTFSLELKELLDNDATRPELTAYLQKEGITTIWDNAIKNVLAGNTTVSELYRVLFQNT